MVFGRYPVAVQGGEMAVHLHLTLNRPCRVVRRARGPMSNAFSVLVGGRSWDWLRELCRPLCVQAQLLDDFARPLLPPETALANPSGPSLRDLASRPDRPLLTAVTRALQGRTSQSLTVEGTDILCT